MKVLKKNQIIIFVIALMLVAAGYLNYTNNEELVSASSNITNEATAAIGDAKLVNSGDVIAGKDEINNTIAEAQNKIEQSNANEIENTSAETTNAAPTKDDYFTTSRLGRDTMYSQMIESYQKILEGTSVSEEQKSIATQEINKINTTKNAIMIAENLIKTKGFEDVVIFVNDASISVVIKGQNLEQDKVAQVQNIIAREMKAQIENIHISNK